VPLSCTNSFTNRLQLIAPASVALPDDIRPAVLGDGGSYRQGWDRWVSERLGQHVSLEGLHDPLVWTTHWCGRPASADG